MTNYEAHIEEIMQLHDQEGGSWLCVVDSVIGRETGAEALCEADCMTCADCADRAIKWLMSDSTDERAAMIAEVMNMVAPSLFSAKTGRKLEQWAAQAGARDNGDVVVSDLPLLDSRKPELSKLTLRVARKVSENEREYRRQRQREGIAEAKKRGVVFGRPRKPLPEDFEPVADMYHRGEITGTTAAKMLDMPLSTFRYYAGKPHTRYHGPREYNIKPIPPDYWPDEFLPTVRQYKRGGLSYSQAAKMCGCRVNTFKGMMKAYDQYIQDKDIAEMKR